MSYVRQNKKFLQKFPVLSATPITFKKKKSKHCSTEMPRGRVRYAVSEKMEEARDGEKRMSQWREGGL